MIERAAVGQRDSRILPSVLRVAFVTSASAAVGPAVVPRIRLSVGRDIFMAGKTKAILGSLLK
jgi:hypothetical protein